MLGIYPELESKKDRMKAKITTHLSRTKAFA